MEAHAMEDQPINELNVGNIERMISAASGAALLLIGIRRHSLSGGIMAILGGALVQRGISGYCPVYQAMGIDHVAETAPPLPEAFQASIDQPDSAIEDSSTHPLDRRSPAGAQDCPHRRAEDEEGIVTEASEESFPASDPPAWTTVSSVGPCKDDAANC